MSSHPPDGSPISPALAEAWRRSGPSAARVARAYTRFLGRGLPRAVGVRSVVGWMAAGMLFGMGSLFAATGLPFFSSRSTPSEPAHDVRPPRNSPAVAHGSGAVAVSSDGEQTAASAASISSGNPRVGFAAPAPASRESWQRVARALRETDFEEAHAALLKLSRQGSEAEREIAKLVRAQVLLRQGRDAEARTLLHELSRSGISTTTRQKAASVLEQIGPAESPHRSFELEPNTNRP